MGEFMYLISIYFDKKTNDIISRYITKVAETTGNTFMTDNNVPPHITVAAFEARNDDIAVKVFEHAVSELKRGIIQYVSVGVFLPYVLYVTPVLNEYLHNMCCTINEKIEICNGIILNKSVHKDILKNVVSNFNKNGFNILGLDFSPIKGPEGNIEYLCYIQKDDNPTTAEYNAIDVVEASYNALKEGAQ